jgi:hypothetical protein
MGAPRRSFMANVHLELTPLGGISQGMIIISEVAKTCVCLDPSSVPLCFNKTGIEPGYYY